MRTLLDVVLLSRRGGYEYYWLNDGKMPALSGETAVDTWEKFRSVEEARAYLLRHIGPEPLKFLVANLERGHGDIISRFATLLAREGHYLMQRYRPMELVAGMPPKPAVATNQPSVQDKSSSPSPLVEKTWVEFQCVDELGAPLANQQYRVGLPDGSSRQGTLDAQGKVRFDQIDPGNCTITFPDIRNIVRV